MGKTTDATKAWLEGLKKTGAISDEELKVLEGTLAKSEVAEYVGSSQLRQDDYSRKLNELESTYKANMQKVQDYERDLANWRGGVESKYSQVQAELAQARAEAARIAQVAKSYGLDESDLGAPVAPVTTPPGTVDPSNRPDFNMDELARNFLTKKDADDLGVLYTLLPAEINDIVAEHQELFNGKSPKGMREIVQQAIKEQRPVRDVYEEKFKVAERRAELEAQAREAEISRRVEEKLTQWRTEHPESRMPLPANQRSYILANKIESPDDVGEAVAHSDSVRAAVSHWNQMDHSGE